MEPGQPLARFLLRKGIEKPSTASQTDWARKQRLLLYVSTDTGLNATALEKLTKELTTYPEAPHFEKTYNLHQSEIESIVGSRGTTINPFLSPPKGMTRLEEVGKEGKAQLADLKAMAKVNDEMIDSAIPQGLEP